MPGEGLCPLVLTEASWLLIAHFPRHSHLSEVAASQGVMLCFLLLLAHCILVTQAEEKQPASGNFRGLMQQFLQFHILFKIKTAD